MLGDFSKARANLLKKKNLSEDEKRDFVNSFDWDKITAQDEKIWDNIFEHLDDNFLD